MSNAELLEEFGLTGCTEEQVKSVCVAVGCDYFTGGVHGVGLKTVCKLARGILDSQPGIALSDFRAEIVKKLDAIDGRKGDRSRGDVATSLPRAWKLFDDFIYALPDLAMSDVRDRPMPRRAGYDSGFTLREWPADYESAEVGQTGLSRCLSLSTSGARWGTEEAHAQVAKPKCPPPRRVVEMKLVRRNHLMQNAPRLDPSVGDLGGVPHPGDGLECTASSADPIRRWPSTLVTKDGWA
mmetsp:Transcript_4364/g.12660  ORF Transcript_4364/g.12660 Transcript_4364/m.12660 type:complete len:239 (+) Transcript_4364:3-719(+)